MKNKNRINRSGRKVYRQHAKHKNKDQTATLKYEGSRYSQDKGILGKWTVSPKKYGGGTQYSGLDQAMDKFEELTGTRPERPVWRKRCDNTDCDGNGGEIQKVEMREEFEGGTSDWCDICRVRDHDMIKGFEIEQGDAVTYKDIENELYHVLGFEDGYIQITHMGEPEDIHPREQDISAKPEELEKVTV